VEIEVSGRQLLIAGNRRPVEPEKRAYQQIEIEHGPFRRVIELGADVVAADTRATYRDGMLRVELPLRIAEHRVRTVPVEAGSSGDRESRKPARRGTSS
jgi:HSP20 family protein